MSEPIRQPTDSAREAPLVSMVITAYNAERFIGACIRAALAQTYPNVEVIVVDDGSTDGTERICRAVTDARFRYLTWGRLGRPKALNMGIMASNGYYIAINDADDLSFPHRIQYSMDFVYDHQGIAYLATNIVETEAFYEAIPERLLTDAAQSIIEAPIWPSRIGLFCRNPFVNSTLLYPKSTWECIGGYDEGLISSEDYDFHLRALQCGPAVLLSGRTVLWYTNPNGFFKKRSNREHMRALGLIKRRARYKLHLPGWLCIYHPMWIVWYELSQRFPSLLKILRNLKKSFRRYRFAGSV